MSDSDALSLDQPLADAVVSYLRSRCFPEARVVRLARGFGIEVSSGRLVIVDPDDWHSDAKTIVRKVVQNAKGGHLDGAVSHGKQRFQIPTIQYERGDRRKLTAITTESSGHVR